MTKEKAIQLLRAMQHPGAFGPQITEDAFTALDMAINVLKKQQISETIKQAKQNQPVDMFPLLSEEEKQQNRWYAQGVVDALKNLKTDGDTIYRRAAIDALAKGGWGVDWDKALAKAIIKDLPSAQPEIIRCRDCKYWREHKYAKETKRYIPFCGFNAIYTKPDDYCSRAERRTDEGSD